MAFEFGGLIEYFTRKIFKEKKNKNVHQKLVLDHYFSFFNH